ncbi:HNH endonuclease family protein [Kutzneria viridogrisea]|uniref:GmrSD restriction endonucleases C-terminal domain-containing protein n=1 Tax=Kutzneria viridogrisea TaxID=47990 RepID=A0ABR6BRE2_9PSEU|nr:hypothetical protein [Kutzneria viridogrisea]
MLVPVAVLAVSSTADHPADTARSSSSPGGVLVSADRVPDAGAVSGSVGQLAALTVAEPHSMAGFSRERFGPGWLGQPGGCTTREAVLRRQGTGVTEVGHCHLAGAWTSPYDGLTTTDPSGLDVDDVVPLADAWRSGADSWPDGERVAFHNDLANPQLLAVSAASNRGKGDKDPSQWKPLARGFWCTYALDWVEVKTRYRLSTTRAEHDALAEMLTTCP